MAIFTGIASFFSGVSAFIGGLGAVGSFLLKTAVGIGVSLLGQALAGQKSSAQNFAINGTMQGGGDLPRSFIFGRYATAGSLVWVNTWGKDGDTPNAYLTQVIALADLPVASLAEFWVNGERVPLGGNGAYGLNCSGVYADNLWVRFHDGTQTVADSVAIGASNGSRSWNSNRVGRGVAYAVVTARVTKNVFSGVPSFKFALQGRKLYDITKDSTAGGVGSHRWSDPSTWGGDGDTLPAVQLYNIIRGVDYNGEWFYGLQNLAAARLPAANWIAQINKCRATILGASGLEPTYRSGGEIHVDAQISTAVEALLTACQGKISEVGGVYTLHCGTPDGPVASFTDGDILSTEEQEFTPFLGLADTINGVSATYPSQSDGWVTKTAPPLYRPDLEAEDGNRRLMADVPLDFVPYAEQVQRLMKSALEEARRFRRHTLVLPPKFWPYVTPGEVIEWTSVRNGYVNKLMRVDGVADRANLDVMIDITEVDPADYDWDSDADFQPPVDGAIGVIRPQPQPIVDWFAEPATVKDNLGVDRRPAIRLTWDNSDGRLDDVIGIEYEVRLFATLEKVTEGRTDQPQAGSMLISQSLLPNESYGVRGRYIPDGDRATLWSDFIPVITPNVLLSDKDVYVDIDLSGVGDMLGWLSNSSRNALEAALELLGDVQENANVGFLDKQELRRELTARAGALEASYTEIVEVAVNQIAAVAGKVETLSAAMGGNAATVNIRWAAVAAPTGYAARYGIEAAVNDGAFRSSSFLMDVPVDPANPTRIILKADQILMISNDDQNIKQPFVFQDGELTLGVANIGTVLAGTINFGNGRVIINSNGILVRS